MSRIIMEWAWVAAKVPLLAEAWAEVWEEEWEWAETWACKEDMAQIKFQLAHPLIRGLEHSRRRQKPCEINLIRFYPG
jgi:hypothetical protein